MVRHQNQPHQQVIGIEDEEGISLEEALEYNKVGFYQYRLLLLCGFAFMTDSLEVNLLSFLSVCAGKEWNLSIAQEASITGIVFAGIICGSGCWGILSDLYGRKVAFFSATAVITIGGLLTGLASSFPLLLLFRGIVGFGIGGTNVPFDLLAELLPSSQRGLFLIYIQFFWTVGTILVTLLAWSCLSLYGWRTLALLTVIPVVITSAFSIAYLPESPHWLLSMGRSTEAEKVLRDACNVNGISMPLDFRLRNDYLRERRTPQHQLQSSSSASASSSSHQIIINSRNHHQHHHRIHYHQPSHVINYLDIIQKKQLRKVTIPLWLVWGTFGCTYYGIILFITRIYSNSSESASSSSSSVCTFDYLSIFYNALSEIGAVLVNGLVLDIVGRVRFQVIGYLLAAVCVFLLGVTSSQASLIIFGFIGRLAVMMASNTTWVATPELFSTDYRTFGHATCFAISKLGAMMSPYIVFSSLQPAAVGTILGLVNLLASISAAFLPETTGMQLSDVDPPSKAAGNSLANQLSGSDSHHGEKGISRGEYEMIDKSYQSRVIVGDEDVDETDVSPEEGGLVEIDLNGRKTSNNIVTNPVWIKDL